MLRFTIIQVAISTWDYIGLVFFEKGKKITTSVGGQFYNLFAE
jgi:hypothetical protein